VHWIIEQAYEDEDLFFKINQNLIMEEKIQLTKYSVMLINSYTDHLNHYVQSEHSFGSLYNHKIELNLDDEDD
jgi:hypothetical protein